MADESRASFGRQWAWLSWLLLAIVLVAALVIGTLDNDGVQSNPERAAAIAATIRCPQCRGQSVAESNVAIAREIRADIRVRINAGETDDEIRQAYVDRYDQSILLTPEGSGFNGLVWIVPVVAAGLAAAALTVAFSRWRTEDSASRATDADRHLVRKARTAPSDAGALDDVALDD